MRIPTFATSLACSALPGLLSKICERSANYVFRDTKEQNGTTVRNLNPWVVGPLAAIASGGAIYGGVQYISSLKQKKKALEIEIAVLKSQLKDVQIAPIRWKECKEEQIRIQTELDRLQRAHEKTLGELEDANNARMDARDQLLALTGAFSKEYNANQAHNAETLLRQIEQDRLCKK